MSTRHCWKHSDRRLCLWGMFLYIVSAIGSASAADEGSVSTRTGIPSSGLGLSDLPSFLQTGASPNFVLSFDDAPSLRKGFLPDFERSSGNAAIPQLVSPNVNRLYYDPKIVYPPALGVLGGSMGHADVQDVDQDVFGVFSDIECQNRDLTTKFVPIWGETNICEDPDFDRSVDENLWVFYLADPGYVHSERILGDDADPDADSALVTQTQALVDAVKDYDADIAPETVTGLQWYRFCSESGADLCKPYYYVLDPDATYIERDDLGRPAERDCPDLADVNESTDFACFKRIAVGSPDDRAYATGQEGGTGIYDSLRDPAVPSDAELTEFPDLAYRNFANWYTYYRTRLQSLKTATSRVLPGLGDEVRVSYQAANTTATLPLLKERFSELDAEARRGFYEFVTKANADAGASSALLQATILAGEFFKQDLPYVDSVDAAATADFSDNSVGARCRNNFHLLFTDGSSESWPLCRTREFNGEVFSRCQRFYGSNVAFDWLAFNQDGINSPIDTVPDGGAGGVPISWTEYPVFADRDANLGGDGNLGMLSDVAFYYWANDLHDSANEVPPLITAASGDAEADYWNPSNDPATWQHVTMFTVGLGTEGNVNVFGDEETRGTYEEGSETLHVETHGWPGSYDNLDTRGANDADDAGQADDLWHSAINGRGAYFSAIDPTELVNSLRAIVDVVSSAQGLAAAAAGTVGSADLSSELYFFSFLVNLGEYWGNVVAYQLSTGTGGVCPGVSAGLLCPDPIWSAAELLDEKSEDSDQRVIFTSAGGDAFEFSVDSLPTAWSCLDPALPNADRPTSLEGEFSLEQIDALCIEYNEEGTDGYNQAWVVPRIDWVRGDDTFELSSTSGDVSAGAVVMRERRHVLGDIIRSGSVVVGPPELNYPGGEYAEFKTNNADRPTVLYVGANDGMLHAFKVSGAGEEEPGEELFAYIPQRGYERLVATSHTSYGSSLDAPHQALMDGPIVSADVQGSEVAGVAGEWKTIVVAARGYGGQGLFALDVSEPTEIIEGDGSDLLLWEFNDATNVVALQEGEGDDSELRYVEIEDPERDGRYLGYVVGAPEIVKIADDSRWVVLVPNGYNNNDKVQDGVSELKECLSVPDNPDTTEDETDPPQPTGACSIDEFGRAALYVLDALSGEVLGIMNTDVGLGGNNIDPVAEYPLQGEDTAALKPNGLGPVTAIDANGDAIWDVAYAGDLFGNVWRFDLTDISAQPIRVFAASSPEDAEPQPITGKIAVARHPTGNGVLLFFGTGQFLEKDPTGPKQIQTFYSIWDAGPDADGNFSTLLAKDLRTDDMPCVDRTDEDEPELGPGERILLKQCVIEDVDPAEAAESETDVARSTVRTSTKFSLDWDRHIGWYIDLILNGEDATAEGERVVSEAALFSSILFFVSSVPSDDPCAAGGVSYRYFVDAYSGAAFDNPVVDFNNSGAISPTELPNPDADTTKVGVSATKVSGILLNSGIASAGATPYAFDNNSSAGPPTVTPLSDEQTQWLRNWQRLE